MSFPDLLGWLLPLFVAPAAVVILLVVMLREMPQPAPLVRVSAVGDLPVGAPGAPDSIWNAKVYPDGGLSFGQHGTLVVSNGTLSFYPDGAGGALWSVPVRSLRVVRRSSFPRFVNIDLDLWFVTGAKIGLVVSQQRINRVIVNDFRTIAQGVAASTFCSVLYANGALAAPPARVPVGTVPR